MDGQLFKMAVENLKWARKDDAPDAAVAERLHLSVGEIGAFYLALTKSGGVTTEEEQLFRRVASVRRSIRKPDKPADGPGAGRRDVIPERSNDVVYVTTSGRAGVFHLRRDCPLLQRGQAAAATMGKEVWSVERTRQPNAEHDGREPCTFCVPALGAAELLPTRVQAAPPTRRTSRDTQDDPARKAKPNPKSNSKSQEKRERDRAAADRLGITVPELKARRRAESEDAARRRRGG